MSATVYVKRGDVGTYTPEMTLLDGAGQPVDGTDATVRWIMRAAGAVGPKVAADGLWADAATGKPRYQWAADDLNEPGVFRGEWEVTYPNDSVETFPQSGWITVVVSPDLDEEEST